MRLPLACLALVAGLALGGAATAQEFPSKPIRVVVPWAAGGVADTAARVVGDRMGRVLGVPVVTENRAGATGMIGTEHVAKSAPDGYTLVLVTASTHAIGPHVFKTVPYDAIKDFTPVSMVTTAPAILVAGPSVPAGSTAELIALAKAKPGQINYASFGNGSSAHLAAELFRQATGIEMVHVPYKGAAPAIVDLLGGQVQIFFDSIPSSLPHVKAGKLKAFGVTSLVRTAAAPDVPTIAETLPGFEMTVFQGFAGPAGMARPIVDRLNAAIVEVMKMDEVRQTLINLGADPVSTTPEAFAAHIARENAKWATVVAKAKISATE